MSNLNYDSDGFIVGINRMTDGIDKVHDDTQELIQMLKSQSQIASTRMKELTRAVKTADHRTAAKAAINTSRGRKSRAANQGQPASDNADSRSSITRRAATRRQNDSNEGSNRSGRNGGNSSNDSAGRLSRDSGDPSGRSRLNRPPSSTNESEGRQRDANGRFTGGAAANNSSSKSGSSSGGRGFNGGIQNVSGVDPVLDSLKEAKDLLSPLASAGKLAGRGVKFSWSKIKALKRREPLPIDQDRHNSENEKLLDKIWKAIRKNGGGGSGGGGGGLLGGLLGGGRRGGRRGGRGGMIKNLFKKIGGVKGLGAIAALAGTAGLAMDWGNLDHKGKSEGVGSLAGGGAGAMAGGAAGAAIGSIVPVVGTIAGGLVGAAVGGWIGSDAGAVIGGAASPYIESWTASMTAYKLPSKIEKVWTDGISPFFTKMNKAAFSLSDKIGSQYKTLQQRIADKFGYGGGGGSGGSGEPAAQALKAADYAIQNAANESLGKCAEYVNNAFQAQGLKASGHGVDVATNLKNGNKGKFEDVAYDENYKPQIGDVMSMPSSKKSKHSFGHAAVYTKEGWVSDYKQGEKYGNTAAPNADYYEDIQSGRIKPKIVRQINTDNPKASNGAKSDQAMKYFMSQGWTKEQAAGIAGNLQQESQFNHKASGDGGKAYGVAQWHPDRQAKFKKKYGKNIQQSTYAEQLAFVQHELTKGDEKSAGNRLKKAKTAASAAAVVSEFYERPKDTEGEKRKRGSIANDISKNHKTASNVASKSKPSSSSNGLSSGNNKAASSLAPKSGYKPANLPAAPMTKFPKMAAPKQRLDSGSDSKPMMMQASNDTITQNVSDRGLAHAITGGLGQDRYWG